MYFRTLRPNLRRLLDKPGRTTGDRASKPKPGGHRLDPEDRIGPDPLVPYRKGYEAPVELKKETKVASKTRLTRSVAAALADVAGMVSAALLSVYFIATAGWLAGSVVFVLATIPSARFLRGLECLVHEGSHWNWTRKKRLNDALVNVLSAFPVFNSVKPYRAQHLVHHSSLGTMKDPDRVRYETLDLETMDRSSFTSFARDVLKRLPAYNVSWYTSIGTDMPTFAAALLWHSALFLAVGAAIGLGAAVLALAHVWVTLFVTLPIVRLVAEASEHRFRDAQTIIGSTVSNLGKIQRLIFHPHFDGHHVVHHLWPAVPHHQLARLHDLLVARDPESYALAFRARYRVLQEPSSGAQAKTTGKGGVRDVA